MRNTRAKYVLLMTVVVAAFILVPVVTAGGQEGRNTKETPTAPAGGEEGLAEETGWDGDLPPAPDQVILDDLIVDGSACIGLDCVNGESFGFDTIRLKENNLRIKFQDTSSTASFPSNDWQITANDSSNGGQNKFSIDDITGGRTPFTIEASAPSHSLYVDDGGRLGLGTNTPVTDVHVKSGNTPTYRLEQDGSSGFTPQTWDVAGNEANFFIRDATNGSTLPFRIRPGAPTSAVDIDGSGNVRIGHADTALGLVHVGKNGTTLSYVESRDGGAVQFRLMSDSSNRRFLAVDNSNTVQSQIIFQDNSEVKLTGVNESDGNGVVLVFTQRSSGHTLDANTGAIYVDNDGSLCYVGPGGTVDLGGGTSPGC